MFNCPQISDFLTIYEGTDHIYNQTGKAPPRTIPSSTSNMTIYFTSGENSDEHKKDSKGFEIAVEYILSGN